MVTIRKADLVSAFCFLGVKCNRRIAHWPPRKIIAPMRKYLLTKLRIGLIMISLYQSANLGSLKADIMDKVLRATHGSPDKPLRIGDIEIPCYVLEGGKRVLSGRGMQTALALGQRHGTLLKSFLGRENIKSHISNDLAMALSNPLRFVRPGRGGKVAVGYDATILPEICDALLAARHKGKLTPKELEIAEQCELLTRAFAKVGIIALIDEVTGYQEERDKEELQKILAAYIAPELMPYTKRFPEEFWHNMFRLRGWRYHRLSSGSVSSRGPRYAGKLTDELVYKQLPPGVRDELRRKSPSNQKSQRKHRLYRFLTEDVGDPHLTKQVAVVTTLMKVSATWKGFINLFEKAFANPNATTQERLFPDLEEDDEA